MEWCSTVSINTLVYDSKLNVLYSGDSTGTICIWNITNGVINLLCT